MSKVEIKGNASGSGTFTIEAPNSNSDITLTLPTTSGSLSVSGGGAALPEAIDVDGSAPADSLAIDASGYVGIGTTSPGQKFHISDTAQTGTVRLRLENSEGASDIAVDANALQFRVNTSGGSGSEAMRIDSNGALLIGSTSQSRENTQIQINNRSAGVTAGVTNSDYNTDYNAFVFYRASASSSGSIRVGGSSVSYNTSSDYRLKENVVDMTGAIDRVKALPVRRFNFIADSDTTVDGFIAHEAQAVVPESVTGAKDAVDDEGNPVYQGIDQSKLVPLLTGALKEAIAKIEALETTQADLIARIEALEATP